MKILQMCAVDFTIRQFLLPLGTALKRAGHEVVFASAAGRYVPEIEAAGFRFLDNPVARSMNVASHAGAIWRTVRLLRRERFDVVHVHTPIAALVGRIAAKLAGVPVKIYTAHGFYFHDEMAARKRAIYVGMEKVGARCGDFIMTVSREDEEAALRLGIARAGEIETIYNGVDVGHFDAARFSAEERARRRREARIPQDARVVGIVGRLVREKGFGELLDAFVEVSRKHPDVWLLVVGDVLESDRDGIKAEFLERAERAGVWGRIVLSGLVEDTAPWLAMMDLFALPSYREGMPVSLLEAMAMGLPAIATDIRGCREEVEAGVTGLLVPARDAGALALAMDEMLSDGTRMTAMGEAGRARVLAHFDIEKVVAHQIAIYGRLTGRIGRQGA